MRFGHNNHFVPREETITETILMDLVENYSNRIRLIKFTGPQETVTGADWEWHFFGQTQAFSMRIQAKKLNTDNLRYETIRHRPKGSRTFQINSLINNALVSNPRCFPAYVFYNYWPGNPPFESPICRSTVPRSILRGCTIASAIDIKRFHKQSTTNLADVNNVSIPWICLFCPLHIDRAHTVFDGSDWLPQYVRKACINLVKGKKKSSDMSKYVPDCSERNRAIALSNFDSRENIKGLAGRVAFFQESKDANKVKS
jgi:hypothetical protein